jgi:fumarylpyruvate hydrolase
MDYIIEPPKTPSVAVNGSDARFPVRRIFCVGRNYEAHAREMGADPSREPPFFFTKPADAVVDSEQTIPYPAETANLHYEAELVVAIGKGGFRIREADAADHIFGYAVGNDLTRRDLQFVAREAGRPWDWGKAFDRSALCAPIHAISDTGEMTAGEIKLSVNGETKQRSDVSLLIWSVREIISILSCSMELKPGDLIYTGTPEGVGPIGVGDTMVASIDGLTDLVTYIGEPV